MRNQTFSSNRANGFFHKFFLSEKLNNWAGFSLAILVAGAFSFLLSFNFLAGVIVFGCIVAASVLIVCFLSPEAGLYIMTVCIFLASALDRFLFKDQFPVGIITDILVFTILFGLFFSNENLKSDTRQFFRTRPVILYVIVLIFLTLELLNPMAHSFLGWFQIMRRVIEAFIIVFIAYSVLDTTKKALRFIKLLLVFALIMALYGCFQQWHGLLQTELNWVNEDPVRFGLICIWGEYRKFSLLGGPTEFGIVMAGCSLLFLLLGWNERKTANRVIYIAAAVFMILGMSYSGTRTANAMLAGGLAFYLFLTINKRSSKIFACVAALALAFVLYAPIYSSSTLNRFRSTFSAKQDASYNVREINRQTVQPFIWSHPFGGGLGTTGAMGQKYNPDNPNAGFPTDSSYLNKALETGWIGMCLTCLFYFFVLEYCIRGYFLAKNKQLKIMLAVNAAFFFSFFLGEIAQEAIGQFSNIVLFYPVLGLTLRLRRLSEEKMIYS